MTCIAPSARRPELKGLRQPAGCATRRICGCAKGHGFICVAKGHGFICVAKGHDFSRAVKRSQFDTFGASAPEASAAKAGEGGIITRRCGTTEVVPFPPGQSPGSRALSQVGARPSRRAPAPACRGPVPMLFVGTRHPLQDNPLGQHVPHVALRFSGAGSAVRQATDCGFHFSETRAAELQSNSALPCCRVECATPPSAQGREWHRHARSHSSPFEIK